MMLMSSPSEKKTYCSRSRRTTSHSNSNNSRLPHHHHNPHLPAFIRVIAPATLQEGYSFDVELQGKEYTVTVPSGGVQEGDSFEIPYPTTDDDEDNDNDKGGYDDDDDEETQTLPVLTMSSEEEEDMKKRKKKKNGGSLSPRSLDDDDESSSNTNNDDKMPPQGRWRHPLWSCCNVLTQSTFWMGWCCTPVLLAQVLTRFRLDWKAKNNIMLLDNTITTGTDNNNTATTTTLSFNRIVLATIAVLMLGYIPVVGFAIVVMYWITVVVWIGSNLRKHIRQRYRIPAVKLLPSCMDDVLCMLCCPCCGAIQMARHTHNDKQYPGACCTAHGLEPDAPLEIVL